jgi:hypothetical protein
MFKLLGIAAAHEVGSTFQYDYCSYAHSQFVLDRVQSEVKPIFTKYGVTMTKDPETCLLNNFDEISR